MKLWELILTAVAVSMDALAVAICKGLSSPKLKARNALTVGAWFGSFQALMPLIGFFLGASFSKYITKYDHWVAFGLLGLIGANMIKESLSKGEECLPCTYGAKAMFPLAVATSVDALAVGVSFAFLQVPIIPAVVLIGCTTFGFSAGGVYLGHLFGAKYKSKAEMLGGVILVLMGLKILLEHLGVL